MTPFQKIAIAFWVAARAGNGGGLVLLVFFLPIAFVIWFGFWLLGKTVQMVGTGLRRVV